MTPEDLDKLLTHIETCSDESRKIIVNLLIENQKAKKDFNLLRGLTLGVEQWLSYRVPQEDWDYYLDSDLCNKWKEAMKWEEY